MNLKRKCLASYEQSPVAVKLTADDYLRKAHEDFDKNAEESLKAAKGVDILFKW